MSITSSSSQGSALDLAVIVKASQTIAREIVLSKLLPCLMKISMENTGAQVGFVILEKAGQWVIEASSSDVDAATVLQSIPIANRLPEAIINYVVRTQESVVLNNSIQESEFTQDIYIQAHQPKSILCVPLLYQEQLSGIIYLENNLITEAFTSEHLGILEILSGQAAIAITNAQLYTAAKERESQLTKLLASVPIGVAIHDTSGQIIYTNEMAHQLTGTDIILEAKTEQMSEVYQLYRAGTNQLYPAAELPIVRALAGETVKIDDLDLRQTDRTISLEVSSKPILDDTGKITCAIAAFQDITERKLAQERIQFQASVLSQIHDAVIAIDNDDCVTYWNPAAERLYNISAEEMLGQKLQTSHQYRWLREADEQVAYDSLATAGFWHGENIHIKKSGEKIYVESSISVLKDKQGDAIGLLAIIRDISDRQQAEEVLRQTQSVLRSFYHSVPMMMGVIELLEDDTRMISCNAATTKLIGLTPENIQNRLVSEVGVPQKYIRLWIKHCREAERTQSPVHFEYLRDTPNGQKCLSTTVSLIPINFNNYPKFAFVVEDITERKEAEVALCKSAKEIHDLYNNAPCGYHSLDADGRFVRINNTELNWFGYTREEIIGKKLTDLLTGESLESFYENFPRLKERGWVRDIEFQMISKDKTHFLFLLSSTAMKDSEGNYVMSRSTICDITERKQAEAALRQSEERFRQLAENIDAVFWMSTQNQFQVIYISPTYDRIWGRSGTDLYENGYLFLDSIYPEDLEQVRGLMQTPDNGYEIEYRILRSDGAIRWIHSRSFPIRNEQGDIYRHARICEDITERKQVEQKILEQATLLDVATDAIFVQDLENQILFWNESAKQLYGWTAEEAIAQNATELLFKVGETCLQFEEIQQTLDRKGSWQGELHQITKDGKDITVESCWTLVHDEHGSAKSILVNNTDITEKKQIAAQLLRVQRLESIGTLASGIAHDLNNVLTPILMSLELLENKFPDKQSQQLLKILDNNAKRGASLVKQVLSFARGVSGNPMILHIRHIILEIQYIIQQTFPKSIEFSTDIQSGLWTVCTDATQLHQVLMNLCINARDAMPNGGSLSICAENVFIDKRYARIHLDARVGPYIIITVADTGTGIPPEIVERIFEPFFSTKEVGKGTGLGLSTVIGIIKSHGGFVNVFTQVGQGSEFKVYLPAVESCERYLTKNHELPTGKGELILVVDDEIAIREITQTSLSIHNYKVLTASDGIEAIALYVKHKNEIAAVCIDMMMPNMDGNTTIRALLKINPQIKVIAMSGLVSNEEITQTAGIGVKAFLSKPHTVQELLKTLNSVLSEN